MPFRRPASLLVLLAVLLPAAARAAPDQAVAITDAVFDILPPAPAQGYFTITNHSSQAMLITGWRAPTCGKLALREAGSSAFGTKPHNSDNLTIPAHRTLTFARGGYHLSCEKPGTRLENGQDVPVTVSFRTGPSLVVHFAVRDPAHH
jgi:periplasmic copper chaperone A